MTVLIEDSIAIIKGLCDKSKMIMNDFDFDLIESSC